MPHDFIKQYNINAEKYADAQRRFYSDKSDESRIAIYSQFDFDLEGSVILDAGCGFGKDMLHFQKCGARIYGIDASDEMVRLTMRDNSELKNIYVQRFENTFFENSFFDAVYSRYAMHYAENLDKVYNEIHRILKPEGRFVFLVAHPLLSFVAKKEKNYHKRETVDIPIFNGDFVVNEPSRTFSDYLTPNLFSLFEMANFYEQTAEDKSNENNFQEVVPDYMLLKLIKR